MISLDMRVPRFFLILLLTFPTGASAQTRLAAVLTFESVEAGAGVVARFPAGASLDSTVARSGTHSIWITPQAADGEVYVGFAHPGPLTGSRLALKAWIRTRDLDGSAALVLSASGAGEEDLEGPEVSGSTDWTEYEVALPLNATADFVHFGLQVTGSGDVWIDDVRLLLDGVPVAGAVAGTLSNRGCMFAGIRSADWRGQGAFEFEFADDGGLRGDGRGPYRPGEGQVETYVENSGIRLYPYGRRAEQGDTSRSIAIDLDRPIGGAADYGTREILALVVHWRQDERERVISGPLDMPVGASAQSERLEVFVAVDGRRHILRFGDLDVSHCWRAAPLDGRGTTQPVLRRVSETEWTVDLPPGSVGRLSESFGQAAFADRGHFEDRGLYQVTARFTFRRLSSGR